MDFWLNNKKKRWKANISFFIYLKKEIEGRNQEDDCILATEKAYLIAFSYFLFIFFYF